MQGFNLCPLTYIAIKALDMKGICENVGYLHATRKINTYNMPLHSIALIRYHDGKMRYLHSFQHFEDAMLKAELQSLTKDPSAK
jgi:hypothetical protein